MGKRRSESDVNWSKKRLKNLSQKCMNLAGICCVCAYVMLILSLFSLLVVDISNMNTEIFLSFSKNGISAFIILTVIGVWFTFSSFYMCHYLRRTNKIRGFKKQIILYVVLTGIIGGGIIIGFLKSNITSIFQIFLEH